MPSHRRSPNAPTPSPRKRQSKPSKKARAPRSRRVQKTTPAEKSALLDYAPVILYLVKQGVQDRLCLISPGIAQWLGVPLSTWDNDPELWLRYIHPDDRNRVRAQASARRPKEVTVQEYRLIASDGREMIVEDRSIAVNGYVHGVLLDMTAHKRVERALVRDRHLFDALMNNSIDRIYFKDTKSRFVLVNQAQAQSMGFSNPAELVGKTDFDFFTWEHARAAFADEQRIMTTGVPLIGKLERVRHGDGTFRWVTATKAPIRDAAGEIIGSFGISRDVTEQKQLEDELEHVKDYLQTLLEKASDIIYTLDANGRFTFINHRLEELANTPAEQLLGRHFIDLILPEDREALAERLRGVPLDRPQSFQARVAVGPEAPLEVEIYTTPIMQDGRFLVALGIARDMTEHNRLERTLRAERDRLDAILKGMAEGVLVTDAGYRLVLVNPAAERLIGLSREELLGHNLDELTLPVTSEDVQSSCNGGTLANVHVPVRAWGAYMLNVIINPLCDFDGERMGTVCVLRDVTELIRIDQIKTEFISLVSHELRTPLTAMKGYTDMVVAGEAGALNAEQAEFLGIVKSNLDRLIVMLNDLLDISKVEAGRIKLYPALVSLTPLVGEIIRSLRPSLESKGQVIYAHLPKGELNVLADRDRLTQILWNLLTNAHKYSPAGAAVRIRVEPVAADRQTTSQPELIAQHAQMLAISVEDDGIGISQEDQARLFTKFFRADNPATRCVGGTGLGLAIVRGFVEMHGGRVWAVSPLNAETHRGSRFTFTIPMIEEMTLNMSMGQERS